MFDLVPKFRKFRIKVWEAGPPKLLFPDCLILEFALNVWRFNLQTF